MNRLLGGFRCRTVVWAATLALAAVATFSTSDVAAQRRGGRGGRGTPAVAATPAGPTAEQTTAARAAYGEGQRLFQAGQFAEAQAQFEAAFVAVPNPVVLLSVAEMQERQGKVPDALTTLERYLTLRADAPDRAAVQTRIDQMRTRPGILAVTSDPPGAAISLDGTPTDRVTPAELEAPPGEHTIALSLDGYEPTSQTVTVTFGTRQDVTVPALSVLPLPEVTAPVDDGAGTGEGEGEGEEESTGPGAGVWVAASIGAVGLVGGTVLGFLALSEQANFDTTPTQETADAGARYALFADVGFGVAIAGFVTALVLNFATGGDEEEEAGDDAPAAETTARLRLTPVVGTNSGGVTARLTF
jgi:tetratricopeptide (TPR) repeat protein